VQIIAGILGSTSLACPENDSVLDGEDRFRIVALWTENKFFDKPVQERLKLVCVVDTIDDVSAFLLVPIGQGPDLGTKVLGNI
jgi:hypothetical protein